MKTVHTPKIILASASPRRIELMKEWGLTFDICPSHVDESTDRAEPQEIVMELALRKAAATAGRLKKGLVVGADTIVVLGREIIGKPVDDADAVRILSALSGSRHRVYTGVALVDASSGESRVAFEVSTVTMRRFPPAEIARLAVKHLDKAGAYAVQETEDAFVDRIDGDYFNVVGLPYGKLALLLSDYGIVLNPPRKSGRYRPGGEDE